MNIRRKNIRRIRRRQKPKEMERQTEQRHQ